MKKCLSTILPTTVFLRLLLGLFSSGIIGLMAYRRRSLSRSGMAGAVFTGTTTFGLGGWSWGLSLIFFFVSSSFLSHFRERDKIGIAIDKFSKGSQRDLGQVIANGGIATLLALSYGSTSSTALRNILRAGYIGALATATADTWATEVGVFSRQQPRLLTTGKPVPAGTSGGVTLLGTGASAAGAFFLGLVFWLLQRRCRAYTPLPLIAFMSGLLGSLSDSLLGATVQAIYYCSACDKETERQIHSCGTKTHLRRGLRWMNNDVVNFMATLVGALVAMVVYASYLIRRHSI
ncbi:MAG TPA: DUF92 domain-containing protein [Ktedonobacteraceae bacterium]|nr:DUF92 domain-containing protein [Ktedonobacteraceae bacterium]